MTSKTTPAAETLQSGPHYPTWCDKDHAQDLADGATVEQAREHEIGGPGALIGEIRNALSGQVTRAGGQVWNLTLNQDTYVDPAAGRPSMCEATVNLDVHDAAQRSQLVTLPLTAGEALVLAAALTSYAHKIILDGT